MSDSDRKLNRYIWPYASTHYRMHLIGIKGGQLGPIDHYLLEQNLIANPECAKTYTDDNFRIIGQA